MGMLDEIKELARLLEAEWRGDRVDRSRLHDVAARLRPHHPDLKHTLASVMARTASA